MSKGNIITPLTPGENIEINEETPNDIYPPSDSKEAHKLDNQNCCKKCECLEIIFFFFSYNYYINNNFNNNSI